MKCSLQLSSHVYYWKLFTPLASALLHSICGESTLYTSCLLRFAVRQTVECFSWLCWSIFRVDQGDLALIVYWYSCHFTKAHLLSSCTPQALFHKWTHQVITDLTKHIQGTITTAHPYWLFCNRTTWTPNPREVAFSSTPPLTLKETEANTATTLAGFEYYIEYLATGKLDRYLDSIQCEDKITDLKVHLPLDPILLLHDLGKHQDQKLIREMPW